MVADLLGIMMRIFSCQYNCMNAYSMILDTFAGLNIRARALNIAVAQNA